ALPGNGVQITLTADGPVGEPASFATDNPARLAIDFAGVSSSLAQKGVAVGVGAVRSVHAVEAGGRTRVVVNLVSPVGYTIDVQECRYLVKDFGTSQSPKSFTR
ncbi:MAG: hypothetical protein B0D82_00715, partial [Candidatus Sedimenticola endophacoides]